MYTRNREFDAYAQSLRRSYWARQFEQATQCMNTTSYEVDLNDLLSAGEAHVMPLERERPKADPRTAR